VSGHVISTSAVSSPKGRNERLQTVSRYVESLQVRYWVAPQSSFIKRDSEGKKARIPVLRRGEHCSLDNAIQKAEQKRRMLTGRAAGVEFVGRQVIRSSKEGLLHGTSGEKTTNKRHVPLLVS